VIETMTLHYFAPSNQVIMGLKSFLREHLNFHAPEISQNINQNNTHSAIVKKLKAYFVKIQTVCRTKL
jgi:hypothetical protein